MLICLTTCLFIIYLDTELLDQSECQDLPTTHQGLIAQAKQDDTTSLNTSTEMIFSDMDNFMNWNTSSSFENIPDQIEQTPDRGRSGIYFTKLYKIDTKNS